MDEDEWRRRRVSPLPTSLLTVGVTLLGHLEVTGAPRLALVPL